MTDLESLSRRVATEVFDYKWDETRCRICGWTLAKTADDGCVADNCSMRPLPERRADTIPPYATSIAHAFEVVEKMRKQWLTEDPDETNYWKFVDCCEHGWRVDILYGHHDGDIPLVRKTAGTLPEAICLAALEYVNTAAGKEI